MTPADRVGVEVEDAIRKAPADEVREIVAVCQATIHAALLTAADQLTALGVGEDAVDRLLGLAPPPIH